MPKVKKARYFRCSNYPYHHWNELDNNEMWITEDKGDKFRVHNPGLSGKKGTVSFQSKKHGNSWLFQGDGQMWMGKRKDFDDGGYWDKCATFKVRKNKFIDGYNAYESTVKGTKGFYIRH